MLKFILVLSLIISGCATTMTKSQNFIFDDKITPAYAIRKISNEQVVVDSAGGVRSIQFKEPITSQDKWHIGSCTKSMTAYLIGILIDEKKLTLDTKVNQVLQVPMSPEVKKITVLNLLTHRSGLVEVNELKIQSAWVNAFNSDSVTKSRSDLVNAILQDKVKFSKDSKFEYSNSNYIVLGAIIEAIEKKPWEGVLKEKIFNILGMNRCGFGPSATRDLAPPDQPWGHKYEKEKLISVQPLTKEIEYSDNPAALGPAGTVHCNFDSWSLFLKEMLAASKGQSKILSAQTSKVLFTPYKDNVANGGWGASEKPWANGIAYTMVGSNTLNYAMFLIAPEKNIILMGATNSGADESLKELSDQLKKLSLAQ